MYNVKKKLNSLLSLFLLITLLCAPLTGCNGSQNPNDSQNPTHTETGSEKDSASESGTDSESSSTENDSELPTDSQEPSSSEDPSQSEGPSQSQQPSQSEKPSQSENPGNSQNPGTSQEPSESERPTQSEQPSQSEKPTESQKPSGSDQPGPSNDPSEPEPTESEDPGNSEQPGPGITGTDMDTPGITIADIPAYTDKDYIVLNNNVPHFATSSSTKAYEFYSNLDSLGRCGIAYAVLGPELLPADDRENIGHVIPSGWVTKDDGNNLYNRSHLIAHSLAGENDNPKNLITGTSHMNQYTMQIFETMVLDYIKETGNHVMYRVTPFFEGNNLVATGVQMEAWSVEDNGEDICFNVFCYNIQEGVSIDYATGNYELIETEYRYIVNGNKSNGKIHTYECGIKSNLKNPIYCKTFEEAQEKSCEVTGKSEPIYAGCCHPENTAP